MMNPLRQLMSCGQSYWLDNLTRDMILSGALQQRVAEQGLRGITSNPATFQKAITGSRAYDEQIKQLVDAGHDVTSLYEHLVVTDIQLACDILRPVYDASAGHDGFVSLEVSPYVAYDADGAMQEARRLHAAVDRPNVMIKIPGTAAGIPAIEEMLYEGVNINITLLFAITDYEAVAEAYIRAMKRRLSAGKSLHTIASVASFFLSRIDVLVDQLLRHRILPDVTRQDEARPKLLLGRVAIANAKLAYQQFKHLFSSQDWQMLAAQGARVQRPLWASTGTKDPSYADVLYVESLIAPNTVNTMPDDTIAAFADHGQVVANAIETNLTEARRILHDVKHMGIDFHCVAWQLQHEGVQKFIEAFDSLQQVLQRKHQELRGTLTPQGVAPSPGR